MQLIRNRSLLVRLFGFPATLVHGDTLVLDRWLWLSRRLRSTRNGEALIDIGCGTGAFTIGASLKGYESLGLSWDTRNQDVATERARLCGAHSARFEVTDVRQLDARIDLYARYDIAICFETIEHILDDKKLITDIAACMKPGGRLLLTTPHLLYRPITKQDMGPFSSMEDGGHVRRGYTAIMLRELCASAGLLVDEVAYCSGFLSQKFTWALRHLSHIHYLLGWTATLPLRLLPAIFDPAIHKLSGWPYYSIAIEAYKPRYAPSDVRLGRVSDARISLKPSKSDAGAASYSS